MHELSAARLPLADQVARILFGPRLHSNQNAARANTLLVFLNTLFGNAPLRKGAYQRTCKPHSPSSGQGYRNGSGGNNAQYGNEQESAHSGKGRGNRADRSTRGPTQVVERFSVFCNIL